MPTYQSLKYLLIFIFALFLISYTHAQKPELFLLKTYKGGDVSGWVMSEKLDGVRAYWDGKVLISRRGKVFQVPKWFTENFPPFALDGELWIKRGDFANISGIVRQKKPKDKNWKNIGYHIFEVPNQSGDLFARLKILKDYLSAYPNPYLHIIQQIPVSDENTPEKFLARISAKGGEGIVIRDPKQNYKTGRLASAFKLKNFLDAECLVRAILPGKGKYENMMGSILCELENGERIKIGSGFSDEMRKNPPEIDTLITFKYYGLTKKAKPRFPVFLRKKVN